MESIIGIFSSRTAAEQAIRRLLQDGIPQASIIFLSGERTESQVQSVPTTDTEPEGMGRTLGAYVGAVTGASAGLSLGTAVASMFVPGIGPILVAGVGAAAALGLGGAAAGAKLGGASEEALDKGVPKDDVFLFRDLLKRGRTLVIVDPGSEEQRDNTESVLRAHGAEDVDAARKEWREKAA